MNKAINKAKQKWLKSQKDMLDITIGMDCGCKICKKHIATFKKNIING